MSKDFNSGKWINGADACYMVGSNMMGQGQKAHPVYGSG